MIPGNRFEMPLYPSEAKWFGRDEPIEFETIEVASFERVKFIFDDQHATYVWVCKALPEPTHQRIFDCAKAFLRTGAALLLPGNTIVWKSTDQRVLEAALYIVWKVYGTLVVLREAYIR